MKHDARKAGTGRAVAQPTERSISGIAVRDLSRGEAVVFYPLDDNQQVRLAGAVVNRIVLPSGSWREHAREHEPFAAAAAASRAH